METFSGSTESPTVLHGKRQLEEAKRQISEVVTERNNLRGRVQKLEALVTKLVTNPSTMMLVDKKCVGPLSEEINEVMGW